MQKIRISGFIDNIFKAIALFFLFFIWLRYFLDSLILALFLSIVGAFLVLKVIDFFTFSKKVKFTLKKELKKDIDSYMLSLFLNSDEENLDFFNSIFKSEGSKIENGFIVNNNCAMIPMFFKNEITMDEIIKPLMRATKFGYKKLIVCCNSCKMAEFNLSSIKLEIFEKEAVFLNIFSKYNVYPKIIESNIKNNLSPIKIILSNFFNKSKAKHFLFFAVITFIFSFFVFYRIYYIVASSIFFIFAFICVFNKKGSQIVVGQNIWE